jgi:hypothetical protein
MLGWRLADRYIRVHVPPTDQCPRVCYGPSVTATLPGIALALASRAA